MGFQALSIPTKITRGMIEITGNVDLLEVGTKVGSSEAMLLTMLNIRPFEYGFDVMHVYDSGSVFSPDILDITEEDIRAKFMAGVTNVAAVSEIEFPEVEQLKAYLADPSAFAVAAPVAA